MTVAEQVYEQAKLLPEPLAGEPSILCCFSAAATTAGNGAI